MIARDDYRIHSNVFDEPAFSPFFQHLVLGNALKTMLLYIFVEEYGKGIVFLLFWYTANETFLFILSHQLLQDMLAC